MIGFTILGGFYGHNDCASVVCVPARERQRRRRRRRESDWRRVRSATSAAVKCVRTVFAVKSIKYVRRVTVHVGNGGKLLDPELGKEHI